MHSARQLSLWVTLLLAVWSAVSAAAEGPVYELRTYVCEPGKLDALHTRFRDHTLKIFEKHGMKNIAYWTPTEGEAAENTLIYILQHESRAAAQTSWEAFRADPEWKAVAAASAQAHGKILARAPDSVYMQATDYSPPIQAVAPDKLYELRVYTANPGKLDALNARFRDHTVRLFRKHGIESVGYWTPIDGPTSATTLIYVLQHASPEAVQPARAAFGADPEWKAAREASEQSGKILAEQPQSTFLKTTDYSPRPQ